MLEDALKQATERAKQGKERVGERGHLCPRSPFPQRYQFIFRFKLESDMVEDRLRRHFDYYLGKTEIVIYSVLAVLLAVTAFCDHYRNRGPNTVGSVSVIGTVAAQTSEGIEPTPRLC